MKKYLIYIIVMTLFQPVFGQEKSTLTLSEYLGYVKKYHPIAKQANLVIKESEAKLLKARGAFDPKIEVDYGHKTFKETEYFDKLNAAFKIPTWYGVELKGNWESNSGAYLNSEANVPTDGLYNIGVSVALAKGLLTNKRMATLKQAKLYQKQAKTDNQLLVNEILYNTAMTYFRWHKSYQKQLVYVKFLENAQIRLEGIQQSFKLGDKPAIDVTEASITLNNRKLNLEKATLDYIKSSLELSNYLWINDVPVEVRDTVHPDIQVIDLVDEALQLDTAYQLTNDLTIHPKLQSLDFKLQSLRVDKRLKQNNLLPKINLNYNFLTQTPQALDTFNFSDYKMGVSFRFPIFLRKDRANLKLTNYKLQAVEFEKQATELSIKNKLNAAQQEITSYENQILISENIVSDYAILLKGEERKFETGEGSLFLINSREAKLIENQLKIIDIENLLLNAKGKLFNATGISQ